MTNIGDIYITDDYVITATLALRGWVNTNRHGQLTAAYAGNSAIRATPMGDLYTYVGNSPAKLAVGAPHDREAAVYDALRQGVHEHKKAPAIACRFTHPTMASTALLSGDLIGQLNNRDRIAVDGLLAPPRGARISDPWRRGDRFGWVSYAGNLAVQLSSTARLTLLERIFTGHWHVRDMALLGAGVNVREECARMGTVVELALEGKDWERIDTALTSCGYSPRRMW